MLHATKEWICNVIKPELTGAQQLLDSGVAMVQDRGPVATADSGHWDEAVMAQYSSGLDGS